jgi:ubiquinone/menaquinone biosynthesis C-methylase UbiE
MPIDWGVGRYETTADGLLPASETAVEAADITRGARVLDIGCGTGHASLLAARSGGDVIAVDPSLRLLDVAAQRSAAAGVTIDFRQGSAADLPLDDATIDVALSVFAVIFAPDPAAAAADIARVLKPTARFVMTAWTPEGAFAETNQRSGAIIRAALGLPDPPPPFEWFKNDTMTELFAPHGFTVRTSVHALAFTAESPEAGYDLGKENPIAVSGREALIAAGHGEELNRIRAEVIEILRSRNEDPAALRVTSTYAVHVLDRGSR